MLSSNKGRNLKVLTIDHGRILGVVKSKNRFWFFYFFCAFFCCATEDFVGYGAMGTCCSMKLCKDALYRSS